MSIHLWYRVMPDGIRLFVRVQANARKNEMLAPRSGRLKIKIQKPAVDGQANKELIKFLSDLFDCSRSSVSVESGETSPEKKVFLRGVVEADFLQRLPFFLF